eukprot:gb/GECG01016701.1/.p1 GENE.gb/GECG01016701.1/~~gb/GECG01016701.1/.p1  ORF type:complete len:944 (+),score=122.40 gb/GECG01016701.1/:1-2832(+)
MGWEGVFEWQSLSKYRRQQRQRRGDNAATGEESNTLGLQEDDSDKIFLPPTILDDLSHDDEVEYPLHFEVVIPGRNTKSYAGVLEFSAPEDQVLLTDKLCEELGVDPEDLEPHNVFIKYIKLPKATKVKFQPVTADFLDIPDHKSTLESVIRKNFTSLSTGKMLRFYHAGKKYELSVSEVEPSDAPAVSLINTDCEVEFAPPLNLGAADGRQYTQSLGLDDPKEDQVLGFEQYRYYKWTATEQNLVDASSLLQDEDDCIGVKFSLDVTVGDADVYISPAPNNHPTLLYHDWGMNDVGGGSVVVYSGEGSDHSSPHLSTVDENSSTFQLDSGTTLYIGVCATDPREYDENAPIQPKKRSPKKTKEESEPNAANSGDGVGSPIFFGGKGRAANESSIDEMSMVDQPEEVETDFVLSVTLTTKEKEAAAQKQGTTDDAQAQAMAAGEETRKCSSCGTFVPASRITMHEAFCARHNQICEWPECRAVFKKGSEEYKKHLLQHKKKDVLYNKLRRCECGKEYQLHQLIRHKKSDCPERLIVCKFCGNTVRAGAPPTDWNDRLKGLTEHESYCGSRTVSCDICGRSVQMKKLEVHVQEVHRNNSGAAMSTTAVPSQSSSGHRTGSSSTLQQHEFAQEVNVSSTGDEEVEVREGLLMWKCRQCSHWNVDVDSKCDVCGGGRSSGATPPDVDMEVGQSWRQTTQSSTQTSIRSYTRPARGGAIEPQSVAPNVEEDVEVNDGLVLWKCPQCGHRNVDIDTTCENCRTVRPSARSQVPSTRSQLFSSNQQTEHHAAEEESDDAMDISSPLSPAPTMARNWCANQACDLDIEAGTVAGSFSLCNRCYRVIVRNNVNGDDVSADDFHNKVYEYLVNKYREQLTTGCGNQRCRNICCRWGRAGAMNEDAAGAAATILAEQGVNTEGTTPKFYVCVRNNPRLPQFQNVDIPSLRQEA